MVEQSLEVDQKARRLVREITESSWKAANGSRQDAVLLWQTFVQTDLENSKSPISSDVLNNENLSSRERLALRIGKNFFGRFNRHLGYDNGKVDQLSWENENIEQFFKSMARTLNGLVDLKGPFAYEVIVNLARANDAFENLVKSAGIQLAS